MEWCCYRFGDFEQVRGALRNDASVEDVVSQAIRRVARSMFGLRPIAQVHIMRFGEEDLRA